MQIKKEQIQHLSKEERNTVTNIIRKYPKFWSSNKYAIGKFKGFKAEIELLEGASAYQKERKLSKNLEEGVCNTMNGLKDQGVFSLSTGEHGRYCANLNVVPKLEGADELRLMSKADKHIQKLQGNNASTASGLCKPPPALHCNLVPCSAPYRNFRR